MQQTGVNIVSRCDGNDGRSRFLRLRYDAELLLCAPAAPTLSRTEDLDLAVRHDFKVDRKVGFKVILGTTRAHSKAVSAGCSPSKHEVGSCSWQRINLARRRGAG